MLYITHFSVTLKVRWLNSLLFWWYRLRLEAFIIFFQTFWFKKEIVCTESISHQVLGQSFGMSSVSNTSTLFHGHVQHSSMLMEIWWSTIIITTLSLEVQVIYWTSHFQWPTFLGIVHYVTGVCLNMGQHDPHQQYQFCIFTVSV